MTTIGLNNASTVNTARTYTVNNAQASSKAKATLNTSPAESSRVSISNEGKALLAAESGTVEPEQTSDIASFAYGALGFEAPEQAPEEGKNTSYTAGTYLKGALTIGSILLAVV